MDGVAVGVTAFHIGDAAHAVKNRLGAPKASASQGDGLLCHGCFLAKVVVQHRIMN
jgi:hypothetical protein